MEQMIKEIYFVHAIDTEGPLYESLEAKFERIKSVYNINRDIVLLFEKRNKLLGFQNFLRENYIKFFK